MGLGVARSIVTCEMVFPRIAGSKVSRHQLILADLHPGGQENPRQPRVCPSFSIVLGNGRPSERSRSGGCGSDGTFLFCLGFFFSPFSPEDAAWEPLRINCCSVQVRHYPFSNGENSA